MSFDDWAVMNKGLEEREGFAAKIRRRLSKTRSLGARPLTQSFLLGRGSLDKIDYRKNRVPTYSNLSTGGPRRVLGCSRTFVALGKTRWGTYGKSV